MPTNKSMRKILGLLVFVTTFTTWATPTITSVTAQQRYPWNGKVDIAYTVTGDIAGMALTNGLVTTLKVTATDTVANTSYTATSAALSGATTLTEGNHAIVWDLDQQGVNLKSSNVVFNVSCETNAALYCVIDLSGGTNTTSYPVTYLAEEPAGGFTNDTYRTTKLALRRCDAGTFIMGEDQSDESHRVTLTKPFYLGVFEVTQKQWSLVMGASKRWQNSNGFGDGYPAHNVGYDEIRGSSDGAKWPSSATVDATSFFGKLQARTKLNFDLPTEAQWEYACRAGTTTTYYWGNSVNGDYAWYSSNSDYNSHPVGTKKPNAWGLYDMSGNVWEWCLDWYSPSLSYGTDPKGSSSGSYQVIRGGSFYRGESGCTSSARDYYNMWDYFNSSNSSFYYYDRHGFRLSRILP